MARTGRGAGRPGDGGVVTADFFTPVGDDAYTFGRIAAANDLSDNYAMGGEPLVAVNLLVGGATSSRQGWRRKCCAAAWTWRARRIVTWRGGTASMIRSRSTAWR